LESDTNQALRGIPMAAEPVRVRRTQRIVRERALRIRSGKSRLTLAMVGCAMVSLFLAVLAVPMWNELDSIAHSFDIPDLQVQMLFLAIWFLPATIFAVLLWRGQKRRPDETAR
jgi:hypothetical protein